MNNAIAGTKLEIMIRKPELNDMDRLSVLNQQFEFAATEEEIRPRLASIQSNPSHVFFVAETDKKEVVGWVHAYEAPSLLSAATAEIGGLIVDENFRRRGIGKLLMAEVEKWAKEKGVCEILLATRVDRSIAFEFYKSLDFSLVHTTHFLRKQLIE